MKCPIQIKIIGNLRAAPRGRGEYQPGMLCGPLARQGKLANSAIKPMVGH